MEDKKSILSSMERREAVQRTMGHASLDTTYGYATELDVSQIKMADNLSKNKESAEIEAINTRASQLKSIEECVQNCVQIANNDFNI